MKALIGKKIGMTQVFNEEGRQIAVTAIQTGPCVVVQCKTEGRDGYNAVQLGFEDQKERRLNKARRGHFAKAKAPAKRILREVRADQGEEIPEAGATIGADIFEGAAYVDVQGLTKGRGFQGVVKRWKMAGGRATHGSKNLRKVGSIGQCEFPARVFKNKKMPGQMGNRKVTTQNLPVVQVRKEDNVILVEGAVPGPQGGIVMVRKALKKNG